MADQLTSTGLTIDSLETRLSRIAARLRTAISPILDLSVSQPTGQVHYITTEEMQTLAELLQELHSAIDPDQATGQSLDALSSITGTYRRAASQGVVPIELNLDATTTATAGQVYAVDGDPDNTWELVADVTSVGAGNYAGTARCQTAGAINIVGTTLTVIVTPQAGVNTVTNTDSPTVGDERETDTELRLRRELEVTVAGSTSADSIQAELSQVDFIDYVVVYENPYSYVANGLPAHSIEAVYWDGGAFAASQTEIARIIHEKKAAGVQSFGSTTVTHTDTQNQDHQISFTLATDIRVVCEIDVDVDDDYVGDAAVRLAVQNWADDNLSVGEEIYRSQISSMVLDLEGVFNISRVQLAEFPSAVADADVTIENTEIGTIDFNDVVVNS